MLLSASPIEKTAMKDQRETQFPTSYRQASQLLHYWLSQTLLIHDDLTLKFVTGGVSIHYERIRIVLFREDGKRMTVRAGTSGKPASLATVEHINRFLPAGYAAEWACGTLRLRHPDGKLSFGNTQQIRLV